MRPLPPIGVLRGAGAIGGDKAQSRVKGCLPLRFSNDAKASARLSLFLAACSNAKPPCRRAPPVQSEPSNAFRSQLGESGARQGGPGRRTRAFRWLRNSSRIEAAGAGKGTSMSSSHRSATAAFTRSSTDALQSPPCAAIDAGALGSCLLSPAPALRRTPEWKRLSIVPRSERLSGAPVRGGVCDPSLSSKEVPQANWAFPNQLTYRRSSLPISRLKI